MRHVRGLANTSSRLPGFWSSARYYVESLDPRSLLMRRAGPRRLSGSYQIGVPFSARPSDEFWATFQQRVPRAVGTAMDLRQLGQALAPDTVLVSFLVHERGGTVFLVRGGQTAMVIGKDLEVGFRQFYLSERIQEFRLQVTTPPQVPGGKPRQADLDETGVAEGRALFALLFPDEIGKAVLGAKRVIISPDGPLWQLPFAALVTNQKGIPSYLGERAALTYTPSLSLYVQSRTEPRQLKWGQRPVGLVVGDPNFKRKVEPDPAEPASDRVWAGLYTRENSPRLLEATRQEAEGIAGLYGSDPLMGDQATEAEVRQRIARADIVHFATHGVLQRALPLSSGIVLTPPERDPTIGETSNDDVLQAWQVFSQMQLRAELVVLSACETAQGKMVRGEGIVGLTRALQYAGARSMLATQWSVDAGETTTKLMETFHKRLRKGLAKDAALQEAMRTVRKQFPHPFYWAPFILLGDPANPNLGTTQRAWRLPPAH
jgi:hypothetical protein